MLESDLDLDPVVAYKCYQERWKIEVMFTHYKSDICLDKVRVQDDFSVIGKEFINVIATIIYNFPNSYRLYPNWEVFALTQWKLIR